MIDFQNDNSMGARFQIFFKFQAHSNHTNIAAKHKKETKINSKNLNIT